MIATFVSSGSAGASDLPTRQAADDRVEQIADARPVLGGDRDHGIEAQRVELDEAGLRLAIVGLVHGDHDRPAALPHGRGNLLVARDEPVPAVEDEDDEIGRRDRAMSLLQHELVQRILARAEHAAGVDDRDVRALPLGVRGDDVAGGAGNRRDDGPARAGQPIEQRGLADIGASDEHDGAFSGGVLTGHDLTGAGFPRLTPPVDSVSSSFYDSYQCPGAPKHDQGGHRQRGVPSRAGYQGEGRAGRRRGVRRHAALHAARRTDRASRLRRLPGQAPQARHRP